MAELSQLISSEGWGHRLLVSRERKEVTSIWRWLSWRAGQVCRTGVHPRCPVPGLVWLHPQKATVDGLMEVAPDDSGSLFAIN